MLISTPRIQPLNLLGSCLVKIRTAHMKIKYLNNMGVYAFMLVVALK